MTQLWAHVGCWSHIFMENISKNVERCRNASAKTMETRCRMAVCMQVRAYKDYTSNTIPIWMVTLYTFPYCSVIFNIFHVAQLWICMHLELDPRSRAYKFLLLTTYCSCKLYFSYAQKECIWASSFSTVPELTHIQFLPARTSATTILV